MSSTLGDGAAGLFVHAELGTLAPAIRNWRMLAWYRSHVSPVASPASRITTSAPAEAKRRARIAPAMPAPTMATS